MKKTGLWRSLIIVLALALSIVIVLAFTVETYRTAADTMFNTTSQEIVTEQTDDEDDIWTYKSKFKTAKQAYDGYKEFAIRSAAESFVLLKNKPNTLPLSKTAKISMLGVRSYAPVYGGTMGSSTDGKSTMDNEIFDAFKASGFSLNPSLLATYAEYFKDKSWNTNQYTGAITPSYADITKYNDVVEFTPDELASLNSEYSKDYAEYNDAAIVVVGRPGSENGAGYYPGAEGLANGTSTVTGNILSLTDDEMAVINHAKAIDRKSVG